MLHLNGIPPLMIDFSLRRLGHCAKSLSLSKKKEINNRELIFISYNYRIHKTCKFSVLYQILILLGFESADAKIM
jgi:hypothetical protein